jgi:DNA-binding CsgD family transcriptional regulator
VNGKRLQNVCNDLNITRLTGRDHLDHVFAKTGVRRQNQLISLMLKGIGLARLCNKKALN